MIRLLDQFLIAVPNIWDEGDVAGVKTLNPAIFIDKERDRYERKVLKGIVYSAPIGYSEEPHMPVDPGIPNHKLFVGHDAIHGMINQGYRWGNEKYHPGAKERFEYLTRGDYGRLITAKAGDDIYFHPSVTEEENYHGDIEGYKLYRAQVHELIAVVSHLPWGDKFSGAHLTSVMPQGFYTLIEPHAEDKEAGGLILSSEDSDRALEGTVRYAREGSIVKPGEFVYFKEGADWALMIEDQRLFAMLEEDILLTACSS